MRIHMRPIVDEPIHVVQPKGFEEPDKEDMVCKLVKALYGCSTSGARWHDTLKTTFTSLGYHRSSVDHCLYYRKGKHTYILVLYVDDVLTMSTGGMEAAEFQLKEIKAVFSIKELGLATHVLDMGISQQAKHITLEQSEYFGERLHSHFSSPSFINPRLVI